MAVSKNKLVLFGLYGEEDLLLPDFLHCETMEYRSEKHNWIIKQHLHANLLQVFLIEKGNVVYLLEDGSHLVTGPCIICIPENTLHGLEVSKTIKGMVLTLSSSFLDFVFQATPQALTELNHIRILTQLKNNPSFISIKQLINELHHEMQDELPEKGLILKSYLSLVMGKIYRLAREKSNKPFTADNRNARYFYAFQRSVKQSYTPMKSMDVYARELNITPVHLTRICQSTVGKSALQIVHHFLFMEAGKYLKHTEYSVSEIAYRLNFEDPAYFSRFFRKLAGLSPKQFREQHG